MTVSLTGKSCRKLDESIREEVIGVLTPQVLAEAVRDLDSDDVVDLVEDLEDSAARRDSGGAWKIATAPQLNRRSAILIFSPAA